MLSGCAPTKSILSRGGMTSKLIIRISAAVPPCNFGGEGRPELRKMCPGIISSRAQLKENGHDAADCVFICGVCGRRQPHRNYFVRDMGFFDAGNCEYVTLGWRSSRRILLSAEF